MWSGILQAQHEQHQSQDTTSKTVAKSPRKVAMSMVGENHVHIDYGSPSVRGRKIWNGLVAYDQVWATGAHHATSIEFSHDVTIKGQKIPMGKYGLFTIPNKKSWIIILNKSWAMHLADEYKVEHDILRIVVKPKSKKQLVEALTYEVVPLSPTKGTIRILWEHVMIAFDFENN